MSARISKLLRILIIALLVLFALYPVITMSIGIIPCLKCNRFRNLQ